MARILLLLITLCSCSLAPAYTRPEIETGTAWKETTSPAPDAAADLSGWWHSFGSEELNALVARALEHNNDLAAGAARVAQARAQAGIAGAALWPQIGLSGSASHSDTDPGPAASLLSAGPTVSYEMDLFGANRSALKAADASYSASQFDLDTLRLAVTGDVASNYFTALGLRQRTEVADETIRALSSVLELIQARFDAGRVSALELAQQKALLSSTLATRAQLAQQQQNTEHALAILIGVSPAALQLTYSPLSKLSLPAVGSSLPSELLFRRPDLAAAEARIQAAGAEIGVARAAFFPAVRLSAGWNIAGETLAGPATSALSLASSLAAPVFQGGRIVSGLERATARQQELIEVYRKSVLTALLEVEDALSAVSGSTLREKHLKVAEQEAGQAFYLSDQLYREGRLDFQSVLDTQRTLLSARDGSVQAATANFNAAVSLYRALGGGWQNSAATSPAIQP